MFTFIFSFSINQIIVPISLYNMRERKKKEKNTKEQEDKKQQRSELRG